MFKTTFEHLIECNNIISFINQKIGAGKTTLSINVATYFARQGHKMLLIDSDKQGSASTWAELKQETSFHVASLTRANIGRKCDKV